MSDQTTAVLDRIVDGETAVLLVEGDGEVIDEVTVPAETLPDGGRDDGSVYAVAYVDGDLASLEYRPGESTDRREAAQERFDRLSSRLGDEDE
ncbi:DUF3006 domain-containing protein [Halovivax gelatinilyticus]|uniref:DUF3006 domain-containing protein n=1 Tax=Halovivax gelatinilyticus TaxID=2961597 RepID=UPI0020CA4202|nr:DUF3006 domain-containing protein [Halovivax gelatinilyticus]